MSPVTPARSKLGREGRMAERRDDGPQQRRGHGESEHDHESERAVVEDRVEQHQSETREAGAEARDEGRVAERRRDGLVGLRD